MSFQGRVHPLTTIQNSNGVPNYGAFLGTAASAELISVINEQAGSTFFGTHCPDTTAAFMQSIILPIQLAAEQIKTNTEVLLNPDIIRPLIQYDDFRYIPGQMQLPILLYAPVRDLYDRGRIEGFGYHHDTLPQEDVYAHILASGRVEDVGEAMDSDGMVLFHWEMSSDDPHLDEEQKAAIRDTREVIDRMLYETSYDPTSWPNERG